jgi:adenylate kinase family enzyme
VGCSGSGKTTLASELARLLGSAHVELDAIYHQPSWTQLGDEEFQARVDMATQGDTWVVDGNYSVVRDVVWEKADAVVWFDLPYATVMARVIRRTVRRTLTRQELWNGNREPFSNLWSFAPEKSIVAWTATRHRVYRSRYTACERDPRWARLRFVRLRSPGEAHAFLAGVASQADKEG